MKDIDFDELDRAVNSLVNPDTATATQAAVTPPVVSAAIDTPSTPPSIAPSLSERRSSGRFMDVVHPSSDMRPSVVSPRPVQQAKQQTTAQANWPDPIDINESTSDPEPVIMTTPLEVAPNDVPAPLESPFLADAKVEKRPLGAFSNEVHESGPTDSLTGAATVPEDAPDLLGADISKSSDHPIEADTPMPAELQPGLLSIEANEDPDATKSDSSAFKASPAPSEPTEPIGPTSITQQYTQQPSTGDKPAATIFDAQAYKKPQARQGKKKSGALIVLWIFLLLVIGAGVGAAVYFFVLPRL
jgi:hypothetical protein